MGSGREMYHPLLVFPHFLWRSPLMPRQVRVQYEDTLYYVMARGNRMDKIVRSDRDRKVFEATLEEVVGRTGWRVYAYALMGNHYHLVFKTPKANLVEGMTWFQNTVTKRHNAQDKLPSYQKVINLVGIQQIQEVFEVLVEVLHGDTCIV
jgi:REP element-mobilizing transposase RayT